MATPWCKNYMFVVLIPVHKEHELRLIFLLSFPYQIFWPLSPIWPASMSELVFDLMVCYLLVYNTNLISKFELEFEAFKESQRHING